MVLPGMEQVFAYSNKPFTARAKLFSNALENSQSDGPKIVSVELPLFRPVLDYYH